MIQFHHVSQDGAIPLLINLKYTNNASTSDNSIKCLKHNYINTE